MRQFFKYLGAGENYLFRHTFPVINEGLISMEKVHIPEEIYFLFFSLTHRFVSIYFLEYIGNLRNLFRSELML